MAALGSNSCSAFSGVRVGGGGVYLVAKECFEVVDFDLCLESCPVDIMEKSGIVSKVSRCPSLSRARNKVSGCVLCPDHRRLYQVWLEALCIDRTEAQGNVP